MGEYGASIANAGAAAHALLQEGLDGLAGAGPAEDVGEGAEHGVGAAGEDLVGPGEVVGEEVGDGAAVSGGAVVGGGEDLDVAGEAIGGEEPGGGAGALEEGDGAAAGDGGAGEPHEEGVLVELLMGEDAGGLELHGER